MFVVILVLTLAPALVFCSGEGNIHLLKNEVAAVLKTCIKDNFNGNYSNAKRDRRSNNNTRDITKLNQYDCTSKNITDNVSVKINTVQINNDSSIRNSTDDDQSRTSFNYTDMKTNRTKRSEPLLNKPEKDQCLSQCVFANLQVVDSRGIPRESELWNLVQNSVTSQQSRTALRDQIRACFQELRSDSEDNGCTYSNKLERCLMLRFSDRWTDTAKNLDEPTSKVG